MLETPPESRSVHRVESFGKVHEACIEVARASAGGSCVFVDEVGKAVHVICASPIRQKTSLSHSASARGLKAILDQPGVEERRIELRICVDQCDATVVIGVVDISLSLINRD